MSVIINELEVVVESPAEPGAGEPEPQEQESPQPSLPAPQDIRDIIRYQAARMARIRAH